MPRKNAPIIAWNWKIICDEENRKSIIKTMSSMNTNDEINLCLCGLISLYPVSRRRPRKDQDTAQSRGRTVYYIARVRPWSQTKEIEVCKRAFQSLHGSNRGKVDQLIWTIKSGKSPWIYDASTSIGLIKLMERHLVQLKIMLVHSRVGTVIIAFIKETEYICQKN